MITIDRALLDPSLLGAAMGDPRDHGADGERCSAARTAFRSPTRSE